MEDKKQLEETIKEKDEKQTAARSKDKTHLEEMIQKNDDKQTEARSKDKKQLEENLRWTVVALEAALGKELAYVGQHVKARGAFEDYYRQGDKGIVTRFFTKEGETRCWVRWERTGKETNYCIR